MVSKSSQTLLAFLLFFNVVSGDFLPVKSELTQVFGESCTNDPSYQVYSFYLNYWPPAINSTFLMAIEGSYTRDCHVDSIAVGTGFNDQNVQYEKIVDINQEYSAGDEYGANIMTGSGLLTGNYVKEFVIFGNDKIRNSMFLACWRFRYVI